MPPTTPTILILAGVFGSMLGSFLNVVIYRLPRRENLAWPGSHCPACGEPIRWFDNLPILSWLLLRGKCRSCRQGIRLRYPLVEALMAALAVLVAWRFLSEDGARDWARFAAALALTASLVAVTFIDAEHRIIPDRITKPGMIVAPLFSLVAPGLHQVHWIPDVAPPAAALLLSLAGILTGAGSIWLMGAAGRVLFKKEAMGLGDVKFMGMVGGFVGPVGVLLAVLLGCVVGSVAGILLWVLTRSHYIPFGPFLSLGTLTVLLFREDVVHFLTVTYPSLFR
jgi:leader peptidase (prepilin peptidase)/N-methyltransferase